MKKSDQTEADAELRLFPLELAVAPVDVRATYADFIARHAGLAGFGEHMLDGHARTLATPELNALFRSSCAIDDVEAAAARYALRVARDPAAAGNAAVKAYKRAAAEQLAGTSGHPLSKHAREYLEAERERDRAQAEQSRLAELAAAERERQEAEVRAAQRAEAERLAAEELAAGQAAASAEAGAKAASDAYRTARVRRFVAELQASGLDVLRVRGGAHGVGRGTYAAAELVRNAAAYGIEQLAVFERVLSDALEAAEEAEL